MNLVQTVLKFTLELGGINTVTLLTSMGLTNYGTGESTPYGTGIGWRGFNGLHDSLKSDVMAIRPMFY